MAVFTVWNGTFTSTYIVTYSIPHKKKKLENVTSTIKQTDRSIKWEGQANIVKHGSHTYLDIW
jgi:hypothetical protein